MILPEPCGTLQPSVVCIMSSSFFKFIFSQKKCRVLKGTARFIKEARKKVQSTVLIFCPVINIHCSFLTLFEKGIRVDECWDKRFSQKTCNFAKRPALIGVGFCFLVDIRDRFSIFKLKLKIKKVLRKTTYQYNES